MAPPELDVRVVDTPADEAAALVLGGVRAALARRDRARVLFASGGSQLGVLAALAAPRDPAWDRVDGFHLDEYVGLSAGDPASLRAFMRAHVVERLRPRTFEELAGDAASLEAECARYAARLRDAPVDVALVGIGDTGHLAFNEPYVADPDDPVAVKVVRLAEASRRQQVRGGAFPTADAVPDHALTVTLPVILGAGLVVAVATGAGKAPLVARATGDPVGPAFPATFLRRAAHVVLVVDPAAGGRTPDR